MPALIFLTSSEGKRFKTRWVDAGFDHGKIEGKSYLLFFIPPSKCCSQIRGSSDLTFSVALRIKISYHLRTFSSLGIRLYLIPGLFRKLFVQPGTQQFTDLGILSDISDVLCQDLCTAANLQIFRVHPNNPRSPQITLVSTAGNTYYFFEGNV